MAKAYSIPIHVRFFRWLVRPAFRALFHILCQVHIQGLANIPKDDQYLVAINHVSLFEPPLVMAFWPVALEAVSAAEIWKRRGQAWLVRFYGGIKVHRGQFDRQLLEQILGAIKAGHSLLIAPEGGRTHAISMRKALPGAAYIVHKTELPVIPVGVLGTTDDLFKRISAYFKRQGPKPRLEMRIGEPFRLPPVTGHGTVRRENLQKNTTIIMAQIGRLLPADYHGFYAKEIQELSNLTV